jgi:biotin transport system substrate-specific component
MKKVTTSEMAMCGIMAALMGIAGPLSVPIGPVPVTLTNLVIYFSLAVCGTRLTLISYIVYLLLGAAGLPVFSGFQGGFGKLAGPTGGYLVGFILMILIGGMLYERNTDRPVIGGAGMFLGLAAAYLFGTAWFVYQMKVGVPYALAVCVWPFIPFDIVKIALGILVGSIVRKAVLRAGYAVGNS